MPKKGGKKDKDAAPPKPKGEFDSLNKDELTAMIVQLRHDKAIAEQQVSQLSAALHRQEAVVDDLDSAARSVQNAHEREIGLMYDESAVTRSELEFQRATTELENRRLKDEIASYIVMQEQNEALKESLSRVHDQMRDKEIVHRAEVDRLLESVTEHKAKLHREFKVRLQEMSGQIAEDKASVGLTVISPSEGQLNKAQAQTNVLHKRAEESASHVSVLMQKYEELEHQHANMKLEHELAQQSMEIQTKEMLQLKRELLESRERCGSMEQDLRAARMERELVHKAAKASEKYEQETTTLQNEVQLMRQKLTSALHASEMWKKRSARGLKGAHPAHQATSGRADRSSVVSRDRSSIVSRQGAPLAPDKSPRRSRSRKDEVGDVMKSMNMKRIYPTSSAPRFGGGQGNDVKRIWNASFSDKGRETLSPASSPRGSVSRDRAATAPLANPSARPVTPIDSFAQLHLPPGGGTLAPEFGIPADGRKSAPPRIQKRPSSVQSGRFFNPT
uniref:Uncharacterized protein n=1 Tax=Hemiselmis tepida TaxID=464990 RepID=A0A7S0WAM7_9CRYP|mmetsp:Transcript_6590/g.16877  ORF Transcript_6590/g.16877 Transcript_6590/m.16877 type:complete len:504 (+) Transcript_6590:132-1643(+)